MEFHKVGTTHRRIRVSSVRAFLDAEREWRAPILAELAELQNEVGLLE